MMTMVFDVLGAMWILSDVDINICKKYMKNASMAKVQLTKSA